MAVSTPHGARSFQGPRLGHNLGDTLWVWTLTSRHSPVGAHPGLSCPQHPGLLALGPARGARAQMGEGTCVRAGCVPVRPHEAGPVAPVLPQS